MQIDIDSRKSPLLFAVVVIAAAAVWWFTGGAAGLGGSTELSPDVRAELEAVVRESVDYRRAMEAKAANDRGDLAQAAKLLEPAQIALEPLRVRRRTVDGYSELRIKARVDVAWPGMSHTSTDYFTLRRKGAAWRRHSDTFVLPRDG